MIQTRPLQGGYNDLLCVELRASDGRHPDCHSVFVDRPTDDGPLLTFFDLFFFSRTYVHIYGTTCNKYNTYYQMRSLDRIRYNYEVFLSFITAVSVSYPEEANNG